MFLYTEDVYSYVCSSFFLLVHISKIKLEENSHIYLQVVFLHPNFEPRGHEYKPFF
jgi:hypothetical protein